MVGSIKINKNLLRIESVHPGWCPSAAPPLRTDNSAIGLAGDIGQVEGDADLAPQGAVSGGYDSRDFGNVYATNINILQDRDIRTCTANPPHPDII